MPGAGGVVRITQISGRALFAIRRGILAFLQNSERVIARPEVLFTGDSSRVCKDNHPTWTLIYVYVCCSETDSERYHDIPDPETTGAHGVQVEGTSLDNSNLVTERSTLGLGKP